MSQQRWVVFTICAGIMMMSMLHRATGAVIAAHLSRDLGFGPREMGLLGAIFFYPFALAQLPVGFLLDRVGAKRVMLFFSTIGLAGLVLFSQAWNIPSALVGRALLGLGMSANMMGSMKLYINWFRAREFATISGLTVSVGALGNLLATTPLVLLVNQVGWRNAFLVMAAFNLALLLGFAAFVHDAPRTAIQDEPLMPRTPNPKMSVTGAVKRLFRDPSYWLIAIPAGLRYGVYAGMYTLWLGPFFMFHLGFSVMTTGNLLLLLSVGHIIGATSGGIISDRILRSRKKAQMISLIVMTVSVFTLANWPGPVYLAALGLLMISFGFVAGFGQVMYAHIKDLMPMEMAGTAMTGINLFVMIGAAVFLHLLGGILDRGPQARLEAGGDYYSAFMLCFAALSAASLLYAFSRDAKVSGSKR